ncbi:hypothetical protein STCU_06488 [Strigomonas culicis]|uniref:Uncharacterized protein n=1 Tax=Strigomonas culicis TaxID=28005 RepID=S9U4P8_9TRYP|nr:hypothetical protein STCU_06488 [Strigomonas culicis]|eukprot:EPY25762.1 hypothetical protein STCU_06488 [Strigomonas culicis]
MFHGSEPARPRTGKGGVGKHRATDHLEATPVGMTPRPDTAVATRRANYTYALRNKPSTAAERPHGRRHVDPTHMDHSDEAKRQAGTIGKNRAIVNEAQMRAAAYYADRATHTLPQPDGAESNLYLTSYYYTPVARQRAAARDANDLSVSANHQSTSVHLAEARLRRMAQEHPQYAQAVADALRDAKGDVALVAREQQLSRKLSAAQYAADSRARVAEIAATTKYHGAADLGRPSPAIEQRVPYALNTSAPRADTRAGAQSGLRISRNPNRESSREATPPPPERRVDRRCYDGPKPYDTVDASGPAYPTPPPVGVSVSLYERPTLVHHDVRQRLECREDMDTLALKRARAARESSVPQGRGTHTAVVGTPALQSPPMQRTRVESRRTGKAHIGPTQKNTRPW